jgi:hypothetical protein
MLEFTSIPSGKRKEQRITREFAELIRRLHVPHCDAGKTAYGKCGFDPVMSPPKQST